LENDSLNAENNLAFPMHYRVRFFAGAQSDSKRRFTVTTKEGSERTAKEKAGIHVIINKYF